MTTFKERSNCSPSTNHSFNIANENALAGLQQIHGENIKLDRPANFFAEMFKSDEVMTKIRSTLVKQQVRMKNFEEVKMRKQMKRVQRQKKFEKQQDRVEEKKRNTAAIGKWKADLQKRRDKAGDLDKYVKDEEVRIGSRLEEGKKVQILCCSFHEGQKARSRWKGS